jgi:hypothetical protein
LLGPTVTLRGRSGNTHQSVRGLDQVGDIAACGSLVEAKRFGIGPVLRDAVVIHDIGRSNAVTRPSICSIGADSACAGDPSVVI